LAPETQADGLGWYGVAPLVLGFAATWTSAPRKLQIKDETAVSKEIRVRSTPIAKPL